jgi:hypothetical protein
MPRPQGGYNLEAISNSAEAVTRALVGEPLDIMRPMRVSELGNEVVYQVVKMQSQFVNGRSSKAEKLILFFPHLQTCRSQKKKRSTCEVCTSVAYSTQAAADSLL